MSPIHPPRLRLQQQRQQQQQQPAAGPAWPAQLCIDSELATAQILAEFQYKEGPRSPSSLCDDDTCRAQRGDECDEKCELPCTADCDEECEVPCTADCAEDDCVVVCGEPHGHDAKDAGDHHHQWCELDEPCAKADCQYSYLDDSCCTACPPVVDPFVPSSATSCGFGQGYLDFDGSCHYNPMLSQHRHLCHHQQYHLQHPHQHHFLTDPLSLQNHHHINPNHYRPQHFNACHPSLTYPTCYNHSSFSRCPTPPQMTAAGVFGSSPMPSLVSSAADSPWSLQSTLSGSAATPFSSASTVDSDNALTMLADYSMADPSIFGHPDPTPKVQYPNRRARHTLADAPAMDMFLNESGFSQNKLGTMTDFGYPDLDGLSKSELESDIKDLSGDLQCRWMCNHSSDPKLCGHHFKTRQELHHHIIEEHVKPIKARGVLTSALNPVCCWHGCDSAKRKKIFKLQHLKDHILCHSKLRVKCEICGKECRDGKVLKLHMNVHRPGQEKPFRCDVQGCGASFGTSALLSSHKRVHTGEKPHKCAWCSYRAADKGNLRRHQEEMHMGKKWPCPYCPQQLAKKANLTRHIRDLHGDRLREEETRPTITPL